MTDDTLRLALRGLLELYEDDEGCRSLPQYVNARAALNQSPEPTVAAAPKASPVEGERREAQIRAALGAASDVVKQVISILDEMEEAFQRLAGRAKYDREDRELWQAAAEDLAAIRRHLSTEAVPVEREQLAQIIARAYGGSIYPGLGELGDYPVDDEAYRAADAILAMNPSLGGGGR